MVAMVPERRGDPAVQDLTAFVFNIMRFATHDGPGIRTVVFFKGCPLSCWWCHNPEGQSFLPDRLYFTERCRHCLECAAICPEHAISEVDGAMQTSAACTLCGTCTTVCMAEARQIAGQRFTLNELIAEVEKDVVFYDESGGGVTLSGGEPLSQPAFVTSFLAACRERGIRTTLETCGFVQPAVFQQAACLADLVLFDLKFTDPAKHRQYTGVSNDLILGNLQQLVADRRPLTVRIPVIPGVNDSTEDIGGFVEYLSRLRPPAVELLPYHRIGADKYRRLGLPYRLADTPQPAAANLARFRDALAQTGLNVSLGG
jgi:pyruvate formate lyase activating enzyme